jgi:hypothetical protein
MVSITARIGLLDPASLGMGPGGSPSLNDVLAVRRDRMDGVKRTIAELAPGELERSACRGWNRIKFRSGEAYPRESRSLLQCLHVVLNEEWETALYINWYRAGSGGRQRRLRA